MVLNGIYIDFKNTTNINQINRINAYYDIVNFDFGSRYINPETGTPVQYRTSCEKPYKYVTVLVYDSPPKGKNPLRRILEKINYSKEVDKDTNFSWNELDIELKEILTKEYQYMFKKILKLQTIDELPEEYNNLIKFSVYEEEPIPE